MVVEGLDNYILSGIFIRQVTGHVFVSEQIGKENFALIEDIRM